ncbi:quinoprotein relay system zinc metallohydrolase 2 [Thauera sp.]|uniref:quinoprotein relay system zinc metallohydrolase 2 n=1 Tax=Thauera sp. TaxID=1905334 RepID=UPI002C2D8817|nr:quinoprotein relay system zinc metallohydrolase 2 [Thauera sp.]HRP25857.1 quinoprotein relay system zinc metallohydrolase 2 [Thauera sp.]
MKPCLPPFACRRLVLLTALLLGAVKAAAAADALPTAEIAPGVFVHQGQQQVWSHANAGDVANLGFVVGSQCVAVIDTGGSPQLGAALLAAVRQATPVPVCYVINTHVHPDHLLGNQAFAALEPRPRFVGHARLPASLSARAPFYRDALQRELGVELAAEGVIFPEVLVDDRHELDLGGVRLTLRAWPTAHTDNDLSVQVGERGPIFLGDLLFAGHLPVIDGRLLGWLEVMDALDTLDLELAIPGHGAPSADWKAAMAVQRSYLLGVRDGVRAAIDAGTPIAETVEALAGAGVDNWLLVDEFHRRNLTAAYAELEWED